MTSPRFPDSSTLIEHGAFVRALARAAVAGDDLVDDVVQDTWVAALQAKHAPRRPLRAWLRGVVRRRAADRVRSLGSARRRDHAAARGEAEPATVDLAASAEIARRLITAVLALPPPYRDVILQRYYDDRPPRVISARLGVPVETVRTRIKRGLAALRAQLDAENHGDRRQWLSGLAPLAFGLPRTPTVLLAGGVLVMKKAALGTTLVLLCAAGIWHLTQRRDPPPSEKQTAEVDARAPGLRGRGRPDPVAAEANKTPPGEDDLPRALEGPLLLTGEVHAQGGRPLLAARVAYGALETATDARGRFQLRVPAATRAGTEIRVRASGFRDERLEVPPPVGPRIDLGVIRLRGEGRLALRIVGAHGEAIPDARVRWHLPPARHDRHPWYPGRPHVEQWPEAGRTDVGGRIVVADLVRDTAVAVFVEARDGRVGCAGPFVLADEQMEQTVALEDAHAVQFVSPVTVDLARGVRISVDRHELSQGRRWTSVFPFEGTRVTHNLPSGRYEVRVWGHGAVLSTETFDIDGPTDIRVAADALRTLTLNLRDEAGEPIPHGRAHLHAALEEGAAGLEFGFVFTRGRWLYDGAGSFGFHAPPGAPARASLSLIAQGHVSVMRRVEWSADETSTTLDLILRYGASLEGRLLGGAPRRVGLYLIKDEVSPCRFQLGVDAPRLDETTSDDAGHFVLRGLGTGRYALVDMGQPDRALARLDLVAGQFASWEGSGPTSRIEVKEPDGKAARPLALLPLEDAENPQRGPIVRGTRQSDTTIFTALPAGSYLVGRELDLRPFLRGKGFDPHAYPSARPSDLPPGMAHVSLESGAVERLTLQAPPDPTPWRVAVDLPESLRGQEVLVAVAAASSVPIFPANVDWKPLSPNGHAQLLFAEDTKGFLLVSLPHQDRPILPYDVVAIVPFERRRDLGTVPVDPPATVEIGRRDEGVTGQLRLEMEGKVGLSHRLGTEAIDNLAPGTWRVTLSWFVRAADGTVQRDTRGFPTVRHRTFLLQLGPGDRKTIDLTVKDQGE